MRRSILRAASCAALGAAACISEISAPSPELPEDRGTIVAQGVSGEHAFAWAPDGQTLFAVSNDAEPVLLAVPIAGGAVTLDGPRGDYADLSATIDAVQFAARDGTTWQAWRLPRAAGEAVALGTTPGGTAAGVRILPAPFSDSAAVVIAPDSLYMVTPEGGRFVAAGCERLVTFSPEADRLLCSRGAAETRTFSIVDMTAGTLSAITLLPTSEGTPRAIAWPAEGLRVLYGSEAGWSIRDVQANTSTLVYSRERPSTALDLQFAAWSPDGRRVAFWTHDCLAGGSGTCDRGQSVIRIVDVVTAQVAIVAVVIAAESGAATLAFSPDGAAIAYVFGDALAVVPSS